MTTPTTNFSWGKPIVSGDSGTWGTELNTVFDSQDSVLGALLSATHNLITVGGAAHSAAAWTTTGLRAVFKSATYTDTSSSGTVTAVYIDAHKAPTLAASSATTFTNAYSVYAETPVAGTNVTLTNAWALGADSAKINGAATVTGLLTASGGVNLGNTTLSNYQEGTWTPADASGASLTFSSVTAKYTRVGRMIHFMLELTYPTTSDTSQAQINGLPVAAVGRHAVSVQVGANDVYAYINGSTILFTQGSTSFENINLTGSQIRVAGSYSVS